MKITTETETITNTEELTKQIVEKTTLHLSKIEDEDLLILKGHLLIESTLRDYCKSKTINPNKFDQAKLSFIQILNLSQAFKGDLENEKWLWETLKNINTLRNQIAHQLENQESLKSNKRKLFQSFNPRGLLDIDKDKASDLYLLKHIIVGTYASLAIELHLINQTITSIFVEKMPD